MKVPIRAYWSLLATYLRPQWPSVVLLAGLLLGTIALELANPQIVRDFIDTATTGGDPEHLMRTALLFMGIALAQQATAVATTYAGERIGWTATNALRGDLADHCLRLDLSFHKARTPGELIERIDGDVTALSRFFSQFVVQLLGNLVLLAGVLVMVMREDWRIGLGLALFVALAIVVLSRLQAGAVPRWAALRQRVAEFYGFLGEQLGGTEDLRANGAAGYALQRFQRLVYELFPHVRRAGLTSYSMWIASLVLFALGTATAFGLSAWLYSGGAITIGTVYLIFSYTELLRRPIEQIRSELEDLQRAGAAIGRVRELFAERTRLADGSGSLPPGVLDVRFERVGFAYEDSEGVGQRPGTNDLQAPGSGQLPAEDRGAEALPPATNHQPAADRVLHNLTFALEPGMVLGLLGRTGSGKTTLARLLMRLYDVGQGAIRLGGTDVRDVPLANLRGRVSLVTQDVQLFQGSLRDNLTFFDPCVPDQQVAAALDEVGLGPWLAALPRGLETPIEAGGLSAGEAQLLALARVFLKDPGLVILDEASSRLDPATEQLLERAIDRLLRPDRGPRTAVIIAHRLATVQRADAIMMLENGRIAEFGPRAVLAADPRSRFSQALRVGLEDVLV